MDFFSPQKSETKFRLGGSKSKAREEAANEEVSLYKNEEPKNSNLERENEPHPQSASDDYQESSKELEQAPAVVTQNVTVSEESPLQNDLATLIQQEQVNLEVGTEQAGETGQNQDAAQETFEVPQTHAQEQEVQPEQNEAANQIPRQK